MIGSTEQAGIPVPAFREHEEGGLLTARSHPVYDLIIWNYTQKCQYEQAWDHITMQARGLITTPDGMIVARPFRKFMNIEQYQGPLPLESFMVTEKLDGSLGVLYFAGGKPYIATRGSFVSEQAVKGTEILYSKYGGIIGLLNPRFTYLFEIIYPANQIVVNYGGMEDLVLLAVIETETGLERDIHTADFLAQCKRNGLFPIVTQYDGMTDLATLRAREEANKEGFVIRFASGLRLKAKYADYVRLHRLVTRVTARSIWDLLKNNQSIDELLDHVPDEFFAWVRRTCEDLTSNYREIEQRCCVVVDEVKGLPTRKEQALMVKTSQYPGVAFAMLDGKDYPAAIWKLLYPEASRPFKIDEEV